MFEKFTSRNYKKRIIKILNLFLILTFILTSGFGCKTPDKKVQEYLKPTTLNYWSVWNDNDAFTDIIADYKAQHPNININYRKFRYDEYEKALLEAFAEDRGPDIFSLDVGLLRKYQTKISPMPKDITMAYQEIKGTIKKEVVSKLVTKTSPTTREIKEIFPDVVYKNVGIDDQVYGLPLALETLVMIYNKDILNNANIAEPPAKWEAFQDAVQKMTHFDDKNKVIQAGTALGGAYNVERNFDIISILMMQNGAIMSNSNGIATFFSSTKGDYNPGMVALSFYTDFATADKKVYSWNSTMPNSVDAFIAGQVGILFGYNYHLPTIRTKAPKLSFGVAPIPQVNVARPTNYANYSVETVSKKSTHQNEAWDFIIFATTQQNEVKKYLDKTNKPAALKSLIDSQKDSEDLHAASTQTLTAQNWYQGKDPAATEKAFKDMVDQVLQAVSEDELRNVMRTVVQKINQTVQ